jgi:putative ABC transport system permease protein
MSARGILFLVARYLRFHRAKTVILTACVTATICLPLTVHRLVERFESGLLARARSTPLVLGARGSRFDLVLHALYFKATPPGTVAMGVVQRIRDSGFARPIPLHARFTARGAPLVGTSLEYFAFRGLRVADGRGLARLGDCVLGARAARDLRLHPGDRLMTDPENVFDIAGSYPVNLRVTGVLAPAGTPDDGAVFADIKTAWLVQGLAHGHQDVVRTTNDEVILSRRADNVVANAALPPFVEVTETNLASFHFHGDPAGFPATAVLAEPADSKSGTLLRGRFQDAEGTEQILVPAPVVEELMGLVFRVKRFFDANMAVVSASTALFLALVVLLSLRLRRREMEVLFMLGCSRGLMVRLQAVELAFVAAASTLLAWAIAEGLARLAPRWMGWE